MDLIASAVGHLLPLQLPQGDCTDRVIIVTGANRGLGLEAARHFVRLNASKVIIACRDLDKAELARQDIEASTTRTGVVEGWQLDLSSFESVRQFAARAAKLKRLDILLHNAGILSSKWEILEGHESHVTVNVISPLLLSLLLLPTLRRLGVEHNTVPRIINVSSDGANLAFVREIRQPQIMRALDDSNSFKGWDRYILTKLLQLMVIQKLAEAVDASGKGHVLINGVNPGLCKTQLFDNMSRIETFAAWVLNAVYGRTAEAGSRTLLAAAFAGEKTHGKWMTNGRKYSLPFVMRGAGKTKLTNRFWDELLGVLEQAEPGITANI
ncbi:Retinol dehydrogenase 11 [Escovopsis weberi]|uniref:Retinol dehydrogenase 11 n=1 Tax=Escovopsis weberi TaxID=150374 RepID=A0A0M9VT37_ESCWE|nr:Retinol dehydrogenase 11 [Escovopsis weberi]